MTRPNKLKVKSIEILWETAHPHGPPGARISFQEQHLGDDVYEFAVMTVTNSNWHKWNWDKKNSDWTPMPPASPRWYAEDDIQKGKKLKVQMDEKEVFVGIGPSLNANQIRHYLNEFIKWADENSSLMEHPISDLSVVLIPTIRPPEYENTNMICFSFSERLNGTGYNFEIINDRLVFAGKNRWQS